MANFHWEGKVEVDKQNWKSLAKRFKHGSPVSENNGRYSIRTISFPSVYTSKGVENIFAKNFHRWHEAVWEWRRGRNKLRINQGRIFSKGVRGEFSFRSRWDVSGAVLMKWRREKWRSIVIGDVFGHMPEISRGVGALKILTFSINERVFDKQKYKTHFGGQCRFKWHTLNSVTTFDLLLSFD